MSHDEFWALINIAVAVASIGVNATVVVMANRSFKRAERRHAAAVDQYFARSRSGDEDVDGPDWRADSWPTWMATQPWPNWNVSRPADDVSAPHRAARPGESVE